MLDWGDEVVLGGIEGIVGWLVFKLYKYDPGGQGNPTRETGVRLIVHCAHVVGYMLALYLFHEGQIGNYIVYLFKRAVQLISSAHIIRSKRVKLLTRL